MTKNNNTELELDCQLHRANESAKISDEHKIMIIAENKHGLWISGPPCDLKGNPSDALITAWAQEIHNLKVIKIDRERRSVWVWTKQNEAEKTEND